MKRLQHVRTWIKKTIVAVLMMAAMVLMLPLSGCSPARRFTRLVERYPGLAQDTTLKVRGTAILPGLTAIDSLVPWPSAPVLIETPRVSVRLTPVRKTGGKYTEAFKRADSAFNAAYDLQLQVDLKPDTVVVESEVTVPVYRPVVVKKRWPWWIIPASLSGVAILVLLLKLK